MSTLRMAFEHTLGRFVSQVGVRARENNYWAPLVIPRARILAEIDRLASLPRPADGRRASLIAHPQAPEHALGLAPGIRVELCVLLPGESTAPFRHNATEVNFCIAGSGVTTIAGRTIGFKQYDVWNHPSYSSYVHRNEGKEVQVRLTYSNVPLLQNMQVYLPDYEAPAADGATAAEPESHGEDPRRQSPFGIFQLTKDGAMMMPYERLINPPSIESLALHWPWEQVKAELIKLEALGKEYVGRRLYLLYNPMTGRTNGTTPNFFATMTIRPPKIVDRPHRHVSAAINYYFTGSGYSSVAGNRYEWQAGDLMFSAPGWAVHNHASNDESVCELTIQDQPLNILMESLLWQEDMKSPAVLLGPQPGFATNRAKVAS